MKKFKLLVLLLLAVFCLQYSFESQAAQTINGKALGSVDDIVKEISKGDVSLPKKGLITLRAGDKIGDVDIFATTFGKDASASSKRIWHNSNATRSLPWISTSPYYLRPAVSRRLYNGKRALMTHDFANNGEFKYYFKALSNNRTEHSDGATTDALVNSVQISDIGEYTPAKFSDADNNFIGQVFGTGVMAVKGYEREIFVAASGANHPNWMDKTIRLEFFGVGVDDNDKITYEALTSLTQETPVGRDGRRGDPKIVSLAVGDFDGDKYDNEVALMINTLTDIVVFVYRLNYSDGKLTLRSMSDASGIHIHATNQWANDLGSGS